MTGKTASCWRWSFWWWKINQSCCF